MLELSQAPASLPPGRRIYAIGDIHGCARQLADLHDTIARDLATRPIASVLLLHIGDYVDRGADTAGVIARLKNGCPVPGMEMVNLMGNHENTMLDALTGERAAGTDWLFAGGKAALQSYGIDPEGARDQWAAQIPQTHQAFLRNLTLMHREGGYAFIHAGVRPGIALENQARDDLLRSRQPFLYSEADFGAVVVHGHTPVKAPVIRHNRIAIDTGAVFGGKLTCAVLEADTLGFLTAEPVDEPVSIAHR
ncbi:MAG: metallophosphoesterase [Rhodopila sp.]|jgi:serine/threonine protein phosphatase 1